MLAAHASCLPVLAAHASCPGLFHNVIMNSHFDCVPQEAEAAAQKADVSTVQNSLCDALKNFFSMRLLVLWI